MYIKQLYKMYYAVLGLNIVLVALYEYVNMHPEKDA